MRRISLAVVSCLLLSLPVSAKQTDQSVAGLTPGMTIDAVASKLGDGYHKATTAMVQKGEVANFTKGLEGYDVLAMGGKAVYIEHQQFFPPDGLIAVDELAKDLSEKYGTPSVKNDDDGSEAWIIVDNKLVAPGAMTDQLRACVNYDMQGPFFTPSDKVNFAFQFPRVPVQDQYAHCGTVIQARPKILGENKGLLSQLTVAIFDIKAAQAWYDSAMADYTKSLKDAVEAARKNKPHL